MIFKRPMNESKEKKAGLFARMRKALGATKENLVGKIESVLSSRPMINEEVLDDLEGTLLSADLGTCVTDIIMNAIREKHKKRILNNAEDARAEIRTQLLSILNTSPYESSLEGSDLRVWMIVGVNGTGKTTTIGKLAAKISKTGKSVLVCAADTFRPAAID